MCTAASSSQVSVGTNNFTGGTVDALVETLSIARDTTASHTASANIIGVLTFNAGRIDANTVYVGNQSLGPSTSSAANLGFVNVNGTATLVVNSNLVLGRTTVNSVAATKTAGTLNINGGTVCANAISVGTFSTNNVILMTNATLVISNAIGAPGYGITRFAISNSVLQLNITGITNAFMTNLITGGTTNMITIGSAAILPSYPAQVTLVKYVGAIGGAGFNFGLNPLPPTAIGFLSNNTANSSIDLVLTTDPRPLITVQPQGAAVNPAEPVTLTVIATGAPTLGYQWLQSGTNVVDGDNISGSASSSLMIASADPTNNGNYTVIVTNAYGSLTSSIAIVYVSASDVAPFISQDPQSQTVLLGQSAMFTVSGAAKPLPTYQWLKAGSVISGATNSSYSIGSAQLTDEAGYSVILSNSVNSITSIVANLTVNIAPVITNQPVSTAVLNSASASFSVVAGGKPVPTYQWYKNNNPITDATNATLPFGSVAPSDAGTYFVVASSSAGSIQSTNVTLIVNSAMAVTGLFPANISSGICADTPLRITFDSAPTIGTTGRIRIFNAANTTTPVDTIDLSLSTGGGTQPRVIAGAAYNTYPVIISGNTANIYPHLGVITTNQTYYVTIENVVNGSFKDSAGATFTGVNATNVWRFTTKPATPANATNIVVAADGSGDFCTVQGAVDFAPSGNTTPRTINLRVGTYTEVVFINGKNNLNFIGQNRDQTIVTYVNNDNLNGGTSARPSFRAAGNDLTFANLTLTNSTPKGGSQAEALRTDGKRILLLGVKLASFQDTILVNNNGDLVYVQDSLIQGDTDFIWGGSTLFVTNSEIRTLTGGTQVTQARTTAGTNGFSFVGCRLTRTDNTVINCGLGRDLGFFDNNVAFINCLIDDHITSWQNADPRDWEFGNSNLTATAAVTYNGVQLAATDPNLTNAQTASLWLYGWSPAYAPLITSQPAPQTVAANSSASFTVGALGVSTPTYQWQKNSTNLVGQTGATLTINNASGNDIGSYSVIVSNAAGTVTSTAALLNVNPPAAGPVLNATALLGNGDIQFSIGGAPGSAGFSYRVWASTNVALSPVTSTWTLLTNDTFSGSPILFTDPQGGGFPQRFYIITVP
jgi:pectin methylesterase-like acyl-CoA thioesterase